MEIFQSCKQLMVFSNLRKVGFFCLHFCIAGLTIYRPTYPEQFVHLVEGSQSLTVEQSLYFTCYKSEWCVNLFEFLNHFMFDRD
jgi:hypothetical protein